MKVAVFLKDNELCGLHEAKVNVVIFNIEKDKVVGVENAVLEEQYKDSIVNWLNRKSINQIYLLEIDDHVYDKIKAHGIQVKTLDTLKNEKLYNSMTLSSLKSETQ